MVESLQLARSVTRCCLVQDACFQKGKKDHSNHKNTIQHYENDLECLKNKLHTTVA